MEVLRMLFKNRNKRIELMIGIVTTCLALAVLWAVLGTPERALADHKPGHNPGGGGGGGGEEIPSPCVSFDDLVGDSVQSDGQDPYGPDKGLPYCDDKQAKVGVSFTNDGHLLLDTRSSAKIGTGRSFFVDFGTDVVLAPGTPNEMTIQTTEDALSDPRTFAVSGHVAVGAFQGEAFDFFNMVEGVPESDVNLYIRVRFDFTDKGYDRFLLRLAPVPLGNGRDCPSSDPVSVTYLGINDETGFQEWIITTEVDNDGDSSIDEDPVDGIDNDEDGEIDEDPVDGLACFSRSGEGEFGDTNLLGHVILRFGFKVTATP
jgi:hypothetical protein